MGEGEGDRGKEKGNIRNGFIHITIVIQLAQAQCLSKMKDTADKTGEGGL